MVPAHFDLVQGFCMRSWKETFRQVSRYEVREVLECRPVCMRLMLFQQIIEGDVRGKLKLAVLG